MRGPVVWSGREEEEASHLQTISFVRYFVALSPLAARRPHAACHCVHADHMHTLLQTVQCPAQQRRSSPAAKVHWAQRALQTHCCNVPTSLEPVAIHLPLRSGSILGPNLGRVVTNEHEGTPAPKLSTPFACSALFLFRFPRKRHSTLHCIGVEWPHFCNGAQNNCAQCVSSSSCSSQTSAACVYVYACVCVCLFVCLSNCRF